MKLGVFSISLSVKDINESMIFYKKLGFKEFSGDITQKWLIMKNEDAVVCLFQGMFEGNLITFNPGWDQNANEISDFEDIRDIQEKLKSKEINFISEVDKDTSGPASFMITDPDGNVILVDQHV